MKNDFRQMHRDAHVHGEENQSKESSLSQGKYSTKKESNKRSFQFKNSSSDFVVGRVWVGMVACDQ